MIFGTKEHFAIECIINNSSDLESIFGHIAIWISKEQLGQLPLTVLLKTPVTHFQESIIQCGKRRQKKFETMNSSEVFNFLQAALWGEPEENRSNIDIIEEYKEYEKFNISTNFSESFDGESLYLIEDDRKERFIWKTFDSEQIKEINLALGTYEKIVQSFLDWFRNQVCQAD
ncbi:MAG: hypothetical protein HC815_23690 [Richelia sp. RM1_1_1]|nr:hypothetical protein [Richelia sp. RM1_1_1]